MRGFTQLPHSIWEEIAGLRKTEKLLYIYLLDKQNFYGNKEFFLTDEVIKKDLSISRQTLNLCRKRLKLLRFLEYESGKWRKSATKYYIKRLIFITKASKNLTSIINNKKEIKEEDFSIPKNWKEETLKTIGVLKCHSTHQQQY